MEEEEYEGMPADKTSVDKPHEKPEKLFKGLMGDEEGAGITVIKIHKLKRPDISARKMDDSEDAYDQDNTRVDMASKIDEILELLRNK